MKFKYETWALNEDNYKVIINSKLFKTLQLSSWRPYFVMNVQNHYCTDIGNTEVNYWHKKFSNYRHTFLQVIIYVRKTIKFTLILASITRTQGPIDLILVSFVYFLHHWSIYLLK